MKLTKFDEVRRHANENHDGFGLSEIHACVLALIEIAVSLKRIEKLLDSVVLDGRLNINAKKD
jgi:hypothetical protein